MITILMTDGDDHNDYSWFMIVMMIMIVVWSWDHCEKDDHFHDRDDRHDNMAIIDMGWMINDDCDEYHESDGHWTLHWTVHHRW